MPPAAPPARPAPPPDLRSAVRLIGPGLLVAATGVGAGDVVAAAVSGSRYGYALVWAAAAGAVLKYVLNEGLARWQLATGTTLLEGWAHRLGRWVQGWFLLYLVLWTFVVGGALISACGLAAHAIAPALSVAAWGTIHSLAAAAMVLLGGFAPFERVMKWCTGVMFAGLVGCALLAAPPAQTLARSAADAAVPPGSLGFILGVIGGVGGSVTLLTYGYWIREKGWEGPGFARMARLDLGIAYGLTGLFGVSVMVLAAAVLHAAGVTVAGDAAVGRMEEMLGSLLGAGGMWAFRLGFWAAVFTSLLGVWQGVPYLFCDFVGLLKRLGPDAQRAILDTRSTWYRGYLLYISVPPLALLLVDRPVLVIVTYAAVGALFMPFLAGTLLVMNSRVAWIGPTMRNGWLTNAALVLCLLLFAWLGVNEVAQALRSGG